MVVAMSIRVHDFRDESGFHCLRHGFVQFLLQVTQLQLGLRLTDSSMCNQACLEGALASRVPHGLAQGLCAAQKVEDAVLRALQQRFRHGFKQERALEKGAKRVRVEAAIEVDALSARLLQVPSSSMLAKTGDALWRSATATINSCPAT